MGEDEFNSEGPGLQDSVLDQGPSRIFHPRRRLFAADRDVLSDQTMEQDQDREQTDDERPRIFRPDQALSAAAGKPDKRDAPAAHMVHKASGNRLLQDSHGFTFEDGQQVISDQAIADVLKAVGDGAVISGPPAFRKRAMAIAEQLGIRARVASEQRSLNEALHHYHNKQQWRRADRRAAGQPEQPEAGQRVFDVVPPAQSDAVRAAQPDAAAAAAHQGPYVQVAELYPQIPQVPSLLAAEEAAMQAAAARAEAFGQQSEAVKAQPEQGKPEDQASQPSLDQQSEDARQSSQTMSQDDLRAILGVDDWDEGDPELDDQSVQPDSPAHSEDKQQTAAVAAQPQAEKVVRIEPLQSSEFSPMRQLKDVKNQLQTEPAQPYVSPGLGRGDAARRPGMMTDDQVNKLLSAAMIPTEQILERIQQEQQLAQQQAQDQARGGGRQH